MNFHLDPHRPHIDGASIRCPGCGQSYDTIVEGFTSLPWFHYPQPTATSKGLRVGVLTLGTDDPNAHCPFTSDDLVAHLFRAQLAAERLEREAAA